MCDTLSREALNVLPLKIVALDGCIHIYLVANKSIWFAKFKTNKFQQIRRWGKDTGLGLRKLVNCITRKKFLLNRQLNRNRGGYKKTEKQIQNIGDYRDVLKGAVRDICWDKKMLLLAGRDHWQIELRLVSWHHLCSSRLDYKCEEVHNVHTSTKRDRACMVVSWLPYLSWLLDPGSSINWPYTYDT